MAHYYETELQRLDSFNFATDVIDYWASKNPPLRAMHWVSQDGKTQKYLPFSHFSRESHRLAVLLREKLKVNEGDRMLMILPRLPVWWELAVAALRSGVVICPATTLLVDEDIKYRAQRSGATVFVGDSASVQKFLRIRQHCPQVKVVIQVDGSQEAGVVDLAKEISSIPDDAIFEGPKPRAEAPAIIYFTSGTTGYPKMVQHNHVSYPLAHTITGKHWLRLGPGKLYWNLSEQGWAKAAWSFFGAWNCGAGLFIHDDRQAFNPKSTLGMLHDYPITTLCAPPTVYRQLVLDSIRSIFEQTPPRALEHCTGAGEPLNAEVIRLWKQMSGIEICDGYGQTETIMMCGNFLNSPVRPGSMGRPSPGVPLHVINEHGDECAVGEEGDIAVSVKPEGAGPKDFFGIFDGYISHDGTLDRRLKAASGGRWKGKSWYRTGDRATRDAEGYFWFVGRSDDVINSAGYRIGPFEVESTLKQHPGVVESAVVSSPDSERGEVVKAFIVLTTEHASRDHTKLAKELQDFCKDKAAPYKYPRKIQFVTPDFLPKTISGKIKRNELKKMEWGSDKKHAAKL